MQEASNLLEERDAEHPSQSNKTIILIQCPRHIRQIPENNK